VLKEFFKRKSSHLKFVIQKDIIIYQFAQNLAQIIQTTLWRPPEQMSLILSVTECKVKMKNKKNYQSVGTVPKSYRKIEEAKLKPLSHISGVAFH
jgi:hypothetical protein